MEAPDSGQEETVAEGFGKLYPSSQTSQQQEAQSDDEQDVVTDVISRKELEKGRLSKDGKYELKMVGNNSRHTAEGLLIS